MKPSAILSFFATAALTLSIFFLPNQLLGQNNDEPVILTSNTLLRDIVENLVGNLVEVKSLYPIGGRSWGAGGRVWPEDMQVALVIHEEGETIDVPEGISSVVLPSQVNKVRLEVLSPAYTRLHLQPLSISLINAYPDFFEEITFNTDLFRSDLNAVDSLIRQGFDTLDTSLPFIIEDQSLHAFCKYFGLSCFSLEEEKPDFAVLLVESTSSPRAIQALADASSWPIIGQVYTRSLSSANGPASTYLELLRSNAAILRRGLQTDIPKSPPSQAPSWMDWRMILFIGVLALVSGAMVLRVVRKL